MQYLLKEKKKINVCNQLALAGTNATSELIPLALPEDLAVAAEKEKISDNSILN